jgi:chromosome segregation ATPase
VLVACSPDSCSGCEEQLAVTREEKKKLESELNTLRYENNDLRSKYAGACSSHTYISEEVNRFKQQASDLANTVALLQHEKESLAYEMVWVMREAIPQVVRKVLKSQEFDDEMEKVRTVLVDQGRELGRRELRDLSLATPSVEDRIEPDPIMLEERERAMAGLKKHDWDCVTELINLPELSTSLLRFVLRDLSGEGPSDVA